MSKEKINRSIQNITSQFKNDPNYSFIKEVLEIEDLYSAESKIKKIQRIEKTLDKIVENLS